MPLYICKRAYEKKGLYFISTQFSQKDSSSKDGESKYLVIKPNLKLRVNGVLAFLRGVWLKPAILRGRRWPGRQDKWRHLWTANLILAVFLFVFSFNFVLASSGSIFAAASPIEWIKGRINNILGSEDQAVNQNTDNQNLIVLQDSYVVKTSPPDAEAVDIKRDLIISYEVKDGDTLIKIANNFGISLSTLLWANDLTAKSSIKLGQQLEILPVDGVLYTVKKGDSIGVIAKKYKTDQDQIIDFNDLPADGSIKEGMQLVLPGGVMPLSVSAPVSTGNNGKSSSTTTKKGSSVASNMKQAAKVVWEAAEKFFIIPVSGLITQSKHRYTPSSSRDVDIGNACGTPVFSDADGVVSYIFTTASRSTSAGGGYGNNIRILHPDGSLTLYGHLYPESILINNGDEVKQGQQIAEIGGGRDQNGKKMMGAGRSSGCHLHYEIRNGTNILLNTGKYHRGMVIKTPAADLAVDTTNVGSGDDVSDNNSGSGGVISEPFNQNKDNQNSGQTSQATQNSSQTN